MNDIQKNGSDSIILAYTDLLGEYMRIVKAAYISTEAEKQIIEIVNHFFLRSFMVEIMVPMIKIAAIYDTMKISSSILIFSSL